ncbi:hypothetical protein NL676_031060 [Syzygium grande]|nr:hypothetical protein NL676_031060 [Syzygium grande]
MGPVKQRAFHGRGRRARWRGEEAGSAGRRAQLPAARLERRGGRGKENPTGTRRQARRDRGEERAAVGSYEVDDRRI